MRLSLKALAIASAIIWGGGILSVGLVNLAAPTYGTAFLQMASSIYPGFHASRSFGDVIVGTLYGVVDAGFGGLVFGWIYNWIAARGT
jgi:4-amino-4-deoxy-L-arabinose transferase-like glycosyltransferase